MEPLDKLEIIILGSIRQKKTERERCRKNRSSPYSSSPLYIQCLDNEIDTLSWVWTEIDAIRQNAPEVSDEIVKKMYGSSKVV